MPLAASELILNARGAIYHLDLHPEQLADTVITVGDPDRVSAVSRYFDRIEHRAQHREFVTHTGYLGGKRLTVVSTGIGPDNIDIVLNELDALANIDFKTRMVRETHHPLAIIRLGTSGALQGDIPVNSIVATSFAIGLDNLMHFYQHGNNPDEQFILSAFNAHLPLSHGLAPYVSEGAIRLRRHFAEGYHTGITVTCPGFYGPQGRVLRAPLAFPNLIHALSTFESRGHRVTNFEMETSALYGLGKLLGHHCLSLSTIVANRVQQTFSPDAASAIDRMITGALSILEKI